MARSIASVKTSSPKRPKLLPCGRPVGDCPANSAREVNPKAAAGLERIRQWQAKLREFLVAEGLKYSEQRWKIAEIILSSGGHLDAQGLVEKVKEAHPEIGAATVYRNIKVLCDANLLKESLTDSHGRVIYEIHDDGHHDHIVCTDCGEIFEFHNDRIEALQNEIVKDMGFTQVKHRHVIYVKCPLPKKE